MTRQSYTAEVFSKTLLLLQHMNGHCQHQDHWESQQEWTFSDPLLAFFILHSTNQIWKDLVIKKHEIEKWRSWWSSIESAWVFHTCLRRCGLVFTVFLGKEKKKKQQTATGAPWQSWCCLFTWWFCAVLLPSRSGGWTNEQSVILSFS